MVNNLHLMGSCLHLLRAFEIYNTLLFCKARVPVRALPSNLLTSNLYFYECFMKNAATPSNSSQTKRDLLLCNPDFLTNELTKKRFFLFHGRLFHPSLGSGADLGGGCSGCAPPPPSPEISCGFLIQLVFCKKKLCGLLTLK